MPDDKDSEKYTEGWTLSTLHKHFTQRFADLNKAFSVFRDTVNRDAIKQNEFRSSLDDLGQKMQTKLEAAALQKANDDKFTEYGKQLAELRSRLDVGSPDVRALQKLQDASIGAQQGAQLTRANFYAGLAAVATIVGIVSFVVGRLVQ